MTSYNKSNRKAIIPINVHHIARLTNKIILVVYSVPVVTYVSAHEPNVFTKISCWENLCKKLKRSKCIVLIGTKFFTIHAFISAMLAEIIFESLAVIGCILSHQSYFCFQSRFGLDGLVYAIALRLSEVWFNHFIGRQSCDLVQ